MILFFHLDIANLIIFDIFSRDSPVPVDIFLLPEGQKLRISRIVDSIKHPVSNKFLPFSLTERDVPGPEDVRVEAGETVPGRTDGHVGEVQVRDGESLDGGGDRTAGPAGEGLLDQGSSSSEASDDDTDPGESDESFFSSNVDQTMDCGRFHKLPGNLHDGLNLLT